MKNYLYLIAGFIIAALIIASAAHAATPITFPINGGTGWASLKNHTVLIGNDTTRISTTSPSTSGFVLTSNGVGADPTFQAVAASSVFPFTPTNDFGVNTSATTTALWGQNSIFASSTSLTVPALAASNTAGNAALFTGTTLSGKFGTTTCPTPNTAVVGAAASVEICGDDNSDGGVNLILGNKNSGGAAFSDLYLQNDASIGNTAAFAVVNFNSYAHTNTDFGQIPSVGAALQLYNQEGALYLGAATTTLANSYTSIFGGGLNFSNELARFTPVNGGSLGLSSSTPDSVLSVNANHLSKTRTLIEAAYSTGATDNATTTVFQVASSTTTNLNLGSTTTATPTTAIGLIDAYSANASTTSILLEAASKGGCIIVKDVQGAGYTQLYAQAGALSAIVHTGSLANCN